MLFFFNYKNSKYEFYYVSQYLILILLFVYDNKIGLWLVADWSDPYKTDGRSDSTDSPLGFRTEIKRTPHSENTLRFIEIENDIAQCPRTSHLSVKTVKYLKKV